MNANEMFPSKYLKAADLGQAKPVVTIEAVDIEEVGQDREKRPVITFEAKEKGLVCNKTNWNTLVKLFGPETNDWHGQRIRLQVVEVQFKGEMVEAIRISGQPVVSKPAQVPAAPVQKRQPATPPATDDDANRQLDAEANDNIPF